MNLSLKGSDSGGTIWNWIPESNCSLFKYADDSTLMHGDVNTAANVVDSFTDWTNTNCMMQFFQMQRVDHSKGRLP